MGNLFLMKSVCISNIKIGLFNKRIKNSWLRVYEIRTHIWVSGHEKWAVLIVSGIFQPRYGSGIKLETSATLLNYLSKIFYLKLKDCNFN